MRNSQTKNSASRLLTFVIIIIKINPHCASFYQVLYQCAFISVSQGQYTVTKKGNSQSVLRREIVFIAIMVGMKAFSV